MTISYHHYQGWGEEKVGGGLDGQKLRDPLVKQDTQRIRHLNFESLYERKVSGASYGEHGRLLVRENPTPGPFPCRYNSFSQTTSLFKRVKNLA